MSKIPSLQGIIELFGEILLVKLYSYFGLWWP